ACRRGPTRRLLGRPRCVVGRARGVHRGAPAPMRLLLLRRTDASVRGAVASPDQVEPTVASASEPAHAKAPHRGGGLSARVPPTGLDPALPPSEGGVLGRYPAGAWITRCRRSCWSTWTRTKTN